MLIYTEHGDSPLVLTVPHDGADMMPGAILRQQTAKMDRDYRDEHTRDIAQQTCHHLRKAGVRPTCIVVPWHRSTLDVNRAPDKEPYADVRCAEAYKQFFATVHHTIARALRAHQRCFLFDIHGFHQSPGPEDYDLVLGTDSHRTCNKSIGLVVRQHFTVAGYRTVFSPEHSAGVSGQYRGGWIVRQSAQVWHTQQCNALQLEINASVRMSEERRTAFSYQLATLLTTLITTHSHTTSS